MKAEDKAALLAAAVNDRLRIRARPNARKTAMTSIEEGIVHLDVAAPPEDGKANKEIERFLGRMAGKRATIKSGFTNKEKTVLLE